MFLKTLEQSFYLLFNFFVLKVKVVKLIEELTRAAEIYKNVSFDNGVVERLLAYARSVSNYPTAVKEVEKSTFFYHFSQ